MTRKNSLPHVVLLGNPLDGFDIVGPFDAVDEAIEWAEHNVDSDCWWTTQLIGPKEARA
jgi:hypothetical protein